MMEISSVHLSLYVHCLLFLFLSFCMTSTFGFSSVSFLNANQHFRQMAFISHHAKCGSTFPKWQLGKNVSNEKDVNRNDSPSNNVRRSERNQTKSKRPLDEYQCPSNVETEAFILFCSISKASRRLFSPTFSSVRRLSVWGRLLPSYGLGDVILTKVRLKSKAFLSLCKAKECYFKNNFQKRLKKIKLFGVNLDSIV